MDLLSEIFKQLNAGKAKDSPEILALLATIKSAQPDRYEIAVQIVENWRAGVAPEQRPWTEFLPGRNALVGGGMGIAGLISVPWIQPILAWLQQHVTMPVIESPVILLGIVGGLGAVAGACYSIYCHRGIVLPTLGEREGVLTLTRFGIVNEIGFGALAAVTTIWLAAVGLALPESKENPGSIADSTATVPATATGTAVPAPKDRNMLSYSVILGSLVSGWFGARMRSFRLDQALLTDALAKTAVSEKQVPGMEQRILAAPNAAAAAKLATGMDVVGANPRPSTITAAGPSELDLKLFKLLDETRVRAAASTSGPVNREGAWLTLKLLTAFDVIDPIIRQVLGELNLKEVASMSLEDFTAKAKAVGLDLPQLALLLATIQSAAKEVVGILGQQSANWSWPA